MQDLQPDTRVRLVDDRGREERVVRLDPNGRFSFDGLTKKTHRFQVEDPRGKGERLIDLSRLGCFEAAPSFSEVWSIAGSPVVMDSKKTPTIPEPPHQP